MNKPILVTVLALSIASPALARGTITVAGEGESWSRPCEGSDVAVQGAGHRITLTGQCRIVTIQGADNEIFVDAAVKIVLQGTNNTVTWRRGARGAKKPRVLIAGVNNRAPRAAGATAGPAVAPEPQAPSSAPRPARATSSGNLCTKDKICPDCSQANHCTRTCKGGGCAFASSGSGAADFSCPAGGCTLNHTGTGAVTLSCPGGNCRAVSTASGTTDLVDCKAGCSLDCSAALGVCEGP